MLYYCVVWCMAMQGFPVKKCTFTGGRGFTRCEAEVNV